jgi:hypothetical protein
MSLLSTMPPTKPELGSAVNRLRLKLAQLRQLLLPTDAELDLAYLNESTDRRNLEYRMEQLDQRLRLRNGLCPPP